MNRKFNTYIPIHGHSTYSFSDGVSKISDIINKAKQLSMPGISLTEHGNMSSFYKFWKLAKKNNINPIIGCEYYVNDLYFKDKKSFLESKKNKNNVQEDILDTKNQHIIAIAKNYKGLKNIIKLSNIGYFNFYYKPLINKELLLNTLDENNIITTSCLASIFSKNIFNKNFESYIKDIETFKEKFKDDFYLEIHFNNLPEQDVLNKIYIETSKKYDIPLVFGLDYHYVEKEDWYIQYLLYLILLQFQRLIQFYSQIPEKHLREQQNLLEQEFQY